MDTTGFIPLWELLKALNSTYMSHWQFALVDSKSSALISLRSHLCTHQQQGICLSIWVWKLWGEKWDYVCLLTIRHMSHEYTVELFLVGFEVYCVSFFQRFWRAGGSSSTVQSPQSCCSLWAAKLSPVERKVCYWSVLISHFKTCTPVCLSFMLLFLDVQCDLHLIITVDMFDKNQGFFGWLFVPLLFQVWKWKATTFW